MELPPVWIDPQLERDFFDTVVASFQNPSKFDSYTTPISWCISLTGRPGTNKKHIVETLATKYNLPLIDTITAELGNTTQCIHHIDKAVEAVKEAVKDDSDVPLYLLILDKADILVRFPDNDQIMLRSLQLGRLQIKGIVLIALFDELYPQSQNVGATFRQECLFQFLDQFTCHMYACSESTSDFRASVVKWYVERFKHSEMVEVDYIAIADATAYATVDDLRVVLQRTLLKALAAPKTEPLTTTLFAVPDGMSDEWRRLESHYSEGMQRGPILKRQK